MRQPPGHGIFTAFLASLAIWLVALLAIVTPSARGEGEEGQGDMTAAADQWAGREKEMRG